MRALAVGCRKVVHAPLDIRATLQPVLLAPRCFTDLVGLQRLVRVVLDRLAGLGIDAVCPVDLLSVLLRLDELPVIAIEGIEKAVAAEMCDDLAILAVYFGVDQLIDSDLVIVEEVTGRVLEVPCHLSGGYIETNRRICEQIVPRPVFGVEHWDRLGGPPDRQLCCRAVGPSAQER